MSRYVPDNIIAEVRLRAPYSPQFAVILGSGFGDALDLIEHDAVIPFGQIKGFPQATVCGHKGRIVFARVGDVRVMFVQGRLHYYEGHSMSETVMPVRLARLLGADKLIVTNSSGGINLNYGVGDFMVICDHINLAPNPLIGENDNALGIRFPDMTMPYDKQITEALERAVESAGAKAFRGVYCQLTGPSFETPAEIKMLRTLGADAVGMSTVCEVIAARHAGMRVGGLSFISNSAAGITGEPLTHEEVNESAKKFERAFIKIISSAMTDVFGRAD